MSSCHLVPAVPMISSSHDQVSTTVPAVLTISVATSSTTLLSSVSTTVPAVPTITVAISFTLSA